MFSDKEGNTAHLKVNLATNLMVYYCVIRRRQGKQSERALASVPTKCQCINTLTFHSVEMKPFKDITEQQQQLTVRTPRMTSFSQKRSTLPNDRAVTHMNWSQLIQVTH